MIVKKWICDGCDAATETPMDATTCTFFQVKVTAGAWGKDVILCVKCNERLLSNIDPLKWPRFAEARCAAA